MVDIVWPRGHVSSSRCKIIIAFVVFNFRRWLIKTMIDCRGRSRRRMAGARKKEGARKVNAYLSWLYSVFVALCCLLPEEEEEESLHSSSSSSR